VRSSTQIPSFFVLCRNDQVSRFLRAAKLPDDLEMILEDHHLGVSEVQYYCHFTAFLINHFTKCVLQMLAPALRALITVNDVSNHELSSFVGEKHEHEEDEHEHDQEGEQEKDDNMQENNEEEEQVCSVGEECEEEEEDDYRVCVQEQKSNMQECDQESRNLVARFAKLEKTDLVAAVHATMELFEKQLEYVHNFITKTTEAKARIEEAVESDPKNSKFSTFKASGFLP